MQNSGSRILYVDDEVGLCRLAQRRLSRLGFDVTVAHSGPDGLARAREGEFDLVALDHYMPGQNGLETLDALMKLPHVPAVVYVTGSDETDVAVNALKAGATDYMVKTASDDFFDLLGRTINQALDTRRILAEKARAEQRLRDSNAQLAMMLSEMNHRVANSLQIVTALVELQERRTRSDETKSMMRDIRQRIEAVSRVHRQLYASGGGARIDMVDYITGMADNLALTFASASAARPITVTADAVEWPAADAISIGILINELVSNACKYAYPDHSDGEVRVIFTARTNDGEPDASCGFLLAVEDDGCGVDEHAVPAGTGIGTQIIRAMADTLGATVTQTNTDPGLRTVIERGADGRQAAG
ncbi:sensor histidine kinase [Novosphingobium sp.]|uniref:sensor histidine kinase n=1 Tax=Novosphingobium sp. TaxID=1874826 RepID=UPI003B52AE00